MSKKDQNNALREENKARLVAQFGGKCCDCGYASTEHNACVFDFHHRDPAEKSFSVDRSNLTRSYDAILEEAKKCDLLCSNCHRIRHHGGLHKIP